MLQVESTTIDMFQSIQSPLDPALEVSNARLTERSCNLKNFPLFLNSKLGYNKIALVSRTYWDLITIAEAV